MTAACEQPSRREPGRDDLEHALARQLARHVTLWARHSGLDEEKTRCLSQQVEQLAEAMESGHVCRRIDDPVLRATLLASGLVALAPEPALLPFVLDDDGRFYLHRYYDYEVRLARALLTRVEPHEASPAAIDGAASDLLSLLFKPDATEINWQKIAVLRALTSRLAILCGGPGTGKTTTVAHYLAALLHSRPETRVALTAPTGKAAARMEEALRQSAQRLPPGLCLRLPNESFTLHRLLGIHPSTGKPRHNREQPLPYDVIIVDEASMLDLALAVHLLEALSPHATLILLGDRDQLAAVEKGVVLGGIAAGNGLSPQTVHALLRLAGTSAPPSSPVIRDRETNKEPPSPLDEHIIHLRRNFRFAGNSGIGQLASAIRQGDSETALQQLASSGQNDLVWQRDGGAHLPPSRLDALADGYAPYVEAVRTQASLTQLHAALGRYRILTALRHGPRGAADLNAQIEKRLRTPLGAPFAGTWFAGRAIIILENEYALDLFNGDIGIALPTETGELSVFFLAPHGIRPPIAPARLPAHAPAWALTVHKAQGSEFDAISLILPDAESRVLTRELLYTGITRARNRVELIGNSEQINEGIRKATERSSGLATRLREENR